MAKKSKRAGTRVDNGVDMTPMIDVVFQLLVYFVVTIKPVDVSAHLDVFRPSMSSPPPDVREPPKMIKIEIFPNALVMNGNTVDMNRLAETLRKLGAISSTQTVMIMCGAASRHEQLVDVLDRCTRAGLTNLSVVSMD